MLRMCRTYTNLNRKLRTYKLRYKDKWKMFIKKAITGVSYFKKLDGMIIEEIIYMLQTEHYDLGEVIIEPGKTINKLRFISDGEIEIMV
jgi:hypothetical protein